MEFRDRYRQKRTNFLKEYLKFQNEISDIKSKDVFKDKVDDYFVSLDDSIKEYKRACTFLKVDRFFGLKMFTFPLLTDIAEAVGIFNTEFQTKLMLRGLILGGLWGWMSAKYKLERLAKKNPCSYLVLLGGYEFKTVSSINYQLYGDINEFVND